MNAPFAAPGMTRAGDDPRPETQEHTRSIAGEATGESEQRQVAMPGQVGRYTLLTLLGAGGMGVVYAAYDPDLDRKVALKLLRPDRAGGSALARLLREAQAQARISHPNVVQIHDTGLIGDQLFLAMEFVGGVDLRRWLGDRPGVGPRPPAERLQAFVAAGRGLAAAHDAGLVHRDFKPENVMVGDDGRVRVIDFGLAREHGAVDADQPRRSGVALDLALTAPGDRLGTPAYMSPEQHLGLAIDARSDQFSFCVALWEALYGRRPFVGDQQVATASAVIAGEPLARPAEAAVPRRIEAALRRGLATAPGQRFPDMHALLAALERGTTRRLGSIVGGLATVGLAGGLALALATSEAPCSGALAALAGTWDADRRAGVAAALAGASDEQPRVLAGLDAFAAAWTAGHTDACLDHRQGEQSSQLFDARVRCLERRRRSLGAAVSSLMDARAGLDAAQIVARLPRPEVCDDPEIVFAVAPPPDDPALARAVEAAEAQLGLARVRHHGGDTSGALELAAATVVDARRLAHRPLLAEALLTVGAMRLEHGDMAQAQVDLGEALVEAVAARRDDLAAEAFARKLYVDGIGAGAVRESLAAAPLALALAERAAEPHAALGLAHNNIGAVHDLAGDHAAAAAANRSALAELSAAPRPDPIELGNVMFNAAMTTAADDPRRALVRRAVDVFTTQLGPRHRMTLDRQQLRAQYEPDPRDAAALLSETCPHYLALADPGFAHCGECWHDLANFAALLGEPAQASAALARIDECATGGPVSGGELLRAKAAALAALLAGQAPQALAAADAALRITGEHAEKPWMAREVAQIELLRGQALLRADRPAEAVAPLERVIEILTPETEHRPALLPRLWLAAARDELAAARREPPTPDRRATPGDAKSH